MFTKLFSHAAADGKNTANACFLQKIELQYSLTYTDSFTYDKTAQKKPPKGDTIM